MQRASKWVGFALACVFGAASACGSKVERTKPAPAPARVDSELVSQLTVLAIGSRPNADELAAAQATPNVREYIDHLVNDPRMGREVVARFTFRELLVTPGFATAIPFYALKQEPGDGGTVNYLRKPCKVDDAVKVHPWWEMDAEILVCPDSYQPDHWVRKGAAGRYGGTDLMQHCNSLAGSPFAEKTPYCGCGPNLLRCYRDKDHIDEVRQSMRDELTETTGYVVDHDLPISELYTSQPTFHDRNVAFVYEKWRIEDEQRGDPDALRALAGWPEHGKWASRPERAHGQHAGVITAPRLVHDHSDRRQRMRDIYGKLWCSSPTSVGATAQLVLALKAKSLQIAQEGWKDLASRPLCTNCHARLDYSWQFMLGWGDGRVVANHFVAALQPTDTVGPLYAHDIRDKRAEAPLETQSFAQVAVAQPEFRDCMVGNVVEHVFGHHASTGDVKALDEAYVQSPTFKNLMRVALVRYAEAWKPPAPSNVASVPAPATAPANEDNDGPIQITPALRDPIDEYCSYCHDEFDGQALPRSEVVRMVDQLAWGLMPRDSEMPDQARLELTRSFINVLWQDSDRREQASRHFLTRMSAMPVHAPAFAANIIGTLAGADNADGELSWSLLESGLSSDELTFTPGYGAFVGLEALERCKAAGHRDAALETCIERATDPAVFSKVRIAAPRP